MSKSIFILILFFSSISTICQASLHPDYDNNCKAMQCAHAEVDPFDNPLHTKYFNKPVPKLIHQIWFGNQNRKPQVKTMQWEKYAEIFDYEYRCYSEKDEAFMHLVMSSDEYDMVKKMLSRKDYWAASDIFRVALLREYGGIYIDCDFSPPHHHETLVDFDQFLDLTGITLVTEHHGREVGESAIFVMNGILMACPHHPIMEGMSKYILSNLHHFYHHKKKVNAMYCTGPILLNKVIWGTFNVVPIGYKEQLGKDD